ncbi:MAG: bifunctional N-acetylglucosamine-1-phosphate uridyltransferase/glucosamine-1-phosphate acetyltransferase [Betaproteobacteria bacterium]|nr:MAG: bifunctional N-acetylglucosamine-1-phosphate uridyltransferase/glucosamine-1-phosphate acetyltransferase [Betaproteobacteria bacterium]
MRSALPKVLHALGGRPLLAHVLATVRTLEPRSICVVYADDAVRKSFPDPDLKWALQNPPNGTGDALAQALRVLESDGVTLVLFGADPLASAITLGKVIDCARAGALSLLTIELDDPTGYGRIVRDERGKVVSIAEEKDASTRQRAIREINTGVMAAPTDAFRRWLAKIDNKNSSGEYYLTDVIALKRDLAELERLYQRAQAGALLDAGVTLADPARIDVRGQLTCGSDVSIDVGCIFEGEVSLADNVVIGAHCVIRNVSVGGGTFVAPFSHIEDAAIGARCRVGPYARIRPGTLLGDEVHIGNFVEIKASAIGVRSKVNHLAYVGDATVGRDVNVGAGTITCNYDGANKHRTVIEDDVHIGSDTQLIAPVTVRQGATIGAGATISKEVPAGQLTISQNKQITIPGWKRPRKG